MRKLLTLSFMVVMMNFVFADNQGEASTKSVKKVIYYDIEGPVGKGLMSGEFKLKKVKTVCLEDC